MTQTKHNWPAAFLCVATIALLSIFNWAVSGSAYAQEAKVLIDEVSARADLLGSTKAWATVDVPAVNGTYRIIGHGTDSIDDDDAFNIHVAGGTYTLSVVDGACCTSLKDATTDAKQGNEPAGEFKWFTDAANGEGNSEFEANSTNFSFNQNPLDAKQKPTASFRVFFGPAGRGGTYWVDIVVSGASEPSANPETEEPDDVPAPPQDNPPAIIADTSPAASSNANQSSEESTPRCRRRLFRWRRNR